MTHPEKASLETLLSLLDEPSQQSASLIMAELLQREEELDAYLKDLQESEDPMVRRRIHQLESIVFLRKRRREFAEKLKSRSIGLLEGLTELHLQWYDNDTADTIRNEWDKVVVEAEKNVPANIESVAYFMRKMGYSAPPPNDMQADYFCLGIVLEERVGIDVVLCAIAKLVGRLWGLELEIIQLIENFAVIDSHKRVLTPRDGWRVHAPLKKDVYHVWDDTTVLRYAMSMLFLCAVCTDSFRYVNTIGSCLAKAGGRDDIDFLPYPYNANSGESGTKEL